MSRPGRRALAILACAGLATHAATALGQLRVANWNVSMYPSASLGARNAAFGTAIYGSFQGRTMAPDILICEEFTSALGLGQFLSMLNSAPGSPGDWNAAPWHDGPDSESVFLFRAAKVQFVGLSLVIAGAGDPQPPRDVYRYDFRPVGFGGLSLVIAGAGDPQPPRDVYRYDFRPVGYGGPGSMVACYAVHMKAGDASADRARRLTEAWAIRGNANALPAGWHFLLAGDTNIPSAAQDAWQELTGIPPLPMPPTPDNIRGRFFDPILSSVNPAPPHAPATWNDNVAWRFIHTQAPASAAGMDDRFDVILLGAGLLDGKGFDYIGSLTTPYSTTTWNDPNHSYRAWGNDGTSFNNPLTVSGNQMVGQTIAQALIDHAMDDSAGGHLPVFVDLRVPGRVGAPSLVNLGNVEQNSPGQFQLTISNAGDVAKWTAAGIANLPYVLGGTGGVSAPGGLFNAAPGAPGNAHTFAINTAALGPFNGSVQVFPTDGDAETFVVGIEATIVAPPPPGCYPNCDNSTQPPVLNVQDFGCFLTRYAAGEPYANCDQSTTPPVLNVQDFGCFLTRYAAGCR